ncbi:MAG: peptide ABC transporter permease [Pelagibacterium sp. SCN 64-44]|nr:MAG: peptide ABC transporter permease [Pelagibacterium sp. SCN 64-44]
MSDIVSTPIAEPAKESKVDVASQWRLIWRQFKKHKIAVLSLFVLIAMYTFALFASFIAPYSTGTSFSQYTYAPPQPIHLFDVNKEGGWRFAPYVNDYKVEVDRVAMRRTFVIDEDSRIYLNFFTPGDRHALLGIPTDIHLFGSAERNKPVFLLGSDRVGRDLFSRIAYATQISLSIGLIGVLLSLTLGLFLGGVSGYYGGWTDTIIQRIIEFVRSVPTIPLWMGLAASLPRDWGPVQVYMAITVILSLVGWTGLARVVRGRFLSLREEDFIRAAKLDGASEARIIIRHMMPAFTSHIIASVTLAVPFMIVAETALSFLGIGLRPPAVSWGTLLQDAQSVRAVTTAPWLLAPAIPVIVSILAFNFLGDGLRDAADPYSSKSRR